jgi:hypothetical protein
VITIHATIPTQEFVSHVNAALAHTRALLEYVHHATRYASSAILRKAVWNAKRTLMVLRTAPVIMATGSI